MSHFSPTLGIWATTKNVLGYTRDNLDVFWHVLKMYLPYFFSCQLFGLILTLMGLYSVESKFSGATIAELLSAYFSFCLVISWHRVVVFGPERATIVNPLAPQKDEWGFIGMSVLFGLAPVFAGFVVGLAGALAHRLAGVPPGIIVLIAAMPVIWLVYAMMRASFYFPAKATSAGISLKEAYRLSRGYVARFFVSSFMLSLLVYIPFMVLAIILGILKYAAVGVPAKGAEPTTAQHIADFVIAVPQSCFFAPLAIAATVACLTNYYLYAVRNGPPRGKA